jgi:hypothetical protein
VAQASPFPEASEGWHAMKQLKARIEIPAAAHAAQQTPGGSITASSRRSIAGVGTIGAASASASRSSYLLAQVDPATVKGAHDDDRAHAPPAFIPSFSSANSFSGIGSARGTSAMLHPGAVDGSTTKLAGRDSGDRAERRSTNFGSCGSAESRSAECPLTPDAKIVAWSPERRSQSGAGLAPGPQDYSSSGDGLGIHQPGSIVQVTKRRQGRARDRAMCPAVARFNLRRAA